MPTSLESRQTVLVLEPDRSLARHIQVCLEGVGLLVPRPCSTAMEALATAASGPPDVVLMDAALLDLSGRAHEFVDAVVSRRVPVIYLVNQADRATIHRAVSERQAAGVLVRPLTDRQLVAEVLTAIARAQRPAPRLETPTRLTADEKLRLIAAIAGDGSVKDDVPVARRRGRDAVDAVDPQGALSARERQIVDLLANGARVSSIATRLQLSPHTVRNHLKAVFRKLNLHGQHELFDYWQQRSA